VPAAPGTHPEPGATGADDGDDDGEDDAEDTLSAEEAEAPHGSEAPRPDPAAATPQERPSFSLFSWLKRESEDKKGTP
jgi:hypothetical protein